MPRNNSHSRKEDRKNAAKERALAAEASGKTVAEREAERGHPAKLNAESKATLVLLDAQIDATLHGGL